MYPFIDKPEREDEELSGLRADCQGQDLNPGLWICSYHLMVAHYILITKTNNKSLMDKLKV